MAGHKARHKRNSQQLTKREKEKTHNPQCLGPKTTVMIGLGIRY